MKCILGIFCASAIGAQGVMVLPPPARYDRAYAGRVVETVTTARAAREICRKRGVDAEACAWTRGGVCHIVIPTDGADPSLARYRSHEIAHCNGWPGHHPK